MQVAADSTDVTTYFVLRLSSNGQAATGLTVTTFDLQYVRSATAPVAKVDATALAATDSAHADNKAFEIDATDQPGLYRVDWPDAAFATGVAEVILTVKCATCFTEHLAVAIDAPVVVADGSLTAAKFAANAITAAKIATDAITSDEIADSGANKIADIVIRRSFENACDSSDGDTKSLASLLGVIAITGNKWSISGTTLTVYEEDGTTVLGTLSLSTDPDAEPVIGAS